MNGGNVITTPDATADGGAMKRWRTLNVKIKFVLKRYISHLFKHIICCKSASENWITLNALLKQKEYG